MAKIILLKGTEPRLYQLVAPLVMNSEILKYNNHYPFKTSDSFVWFVAVKEELVQGFVPVEIRGKHFVINNYYVDEELEKKLFPQLLKAVLKKLEDHSKTFQAVVMVRHAQYFADMGFEVIKSWRLYQKMEKA